MKLTFNKQAAKIFKPEQDTDSLQELSNSFLEYRAKKEKYKERMRKYEKKEELAEEVLYKQMIQQKLKSFKRKDGALLSTSDKKHYFINSEKKEAFFKLLEKIGEGEIIKTDVGWQSIQALMGKIDGNITSEIVNVRVKNKRLRKCLMEVLKFTERTSIRVTGMKRGGV